MLEIKDFFTLHLNLHPIPTDTGGQIPTEKETHIGQLQRKIKQQGPAPEPKDPDASQELVAAWLSRGDWSHALPTAPLACEEHAACPRHLWDHFFGTAKLP